MIHVPFSAISGECTLGEILDDARWRYVRTLNYGFVTALPMMAYQVLDDFDPHSPLFSQISDTPERVIFIGAEKHYGRYVVDQALAVGNLTARTPRRARIEKLDSRHPALLPSPTRPLRVTYASMQKSRSPILAWLVPTGKKRVPYLGIALVAGTDAVAEVRKQMSLDGNKALNFLCHPVLAEKL
jgi:hypothetical protein